MRKYLFAVLIRCCPLINFPIYILLIYMPLSLAAQDMPINYEAKISPLLHSYLKTSNGGSIIVSILSNSSNVLQPLVSSQSLTILSRQRLGSDSIFTCKLDKNVLDSLGPMPEIKFVDRVRKPFTEFKQEGLDLTLNEVRYMQYNFPELTGNDLTLSIKENLFDTTDIDFKNRVVAMERASSHIDMHATNMATISAGGGNSSPKGKGVACDANISSSDFSNLFPDPEEYFIDHNISVQNHAYGTGIENYYGPEAVAYDDLVARHPWIMHVFSAGNVGDQTPPEGKYQGIGGWANLTGQFKQSKNTLTVGATDSLNNVVSLSSRGPAYDGRIKPEVVAYGHGGSSGAAAIVSGLSLLMQESYFKINGQLPPSSLIKAALINSTQDLYAPGPDFVSGFGAVCAFNAVASIMDTQYHIDSLISGQSKRLSVNVFEGAAFNVTIAWEDPAGEVLSQKSLVNDLDITLENIVTGERWYPWVLNSAASNDSLQLPATNGIDTLNNFEKITLLVPDSGVYFLTVSSKNMQTPSQQFSVVWQNDQHLQFGFTFPTEEDYLEAGARNMIRWKSTDTIYGRLDYKIGDGPWVLLKDSVNSADRSFIWNAPDIHGKVQVRWSSSSYTRVSDVVVMTNPLQPKVVLLCPDSLIVNWANKGQADSFELFKLGERHLVHHKFVSDTFFVENDPDPGNPYYAIAPLYDGIKGPLSYTFDYTLQGGGCFLETFYFLHVLNDKAFFAANLSVTNEIDSVIFEEKINGVFIPVVALNNVDSSTLFFTSNILRQGINYFRLRLILHDGHEILSQVERVYFNKNNTVLLFPNPVRAGEQINLLVKHIDDFDIILRDIQGKELFRINDLESPVILPPLSLVPGIYIYQIVSPQGQLYGKFQVN